jgi:hypothetical protein
MDKFTVRNATKFVVTAVIKAKAANVTEEIITDYTRFEEDDMVVDITGSLVGWYIGDKVKPITDKMVDKTADKIVAVREKRAAKKDTEEK